MPVQIHGHSQKRKRWLGEEGGVCSLPPMVGRDGMDAPMFLKDLRGAADPAMTMLYRRILEAASD